jgi:hypothetical protein
MHYQISFGSFAAQKLSKAAPGSNEKPGFRSDTIYGYAFIRLSFLVVWQKFRGPIADDL